MKKFILIYGPQGSGKTRLAQHLSLIIGETPSAVFSSNPAARKIEVPSGTRVVIFDELSECGLLPYGVEFLLNGEPIEPQPHSIMCVQKDSEFLRFRPDTMYIKLPEMTAQYVATRQYVPDENHVNPVQ